MTEEPDYPRIRIDHDAPTFNQQLGLPIEYMMDRLPAIVKEFNRELSNPLSTKARTIEMFMELNETEKVIFFQYILSCLIETRLRARLESSGMPSEIDILQSLFECMEKEAQKDKERDDDFWKRNL